MAKYRKKPVIVDAVELRWDNWSEMCEHADVGRLENGKAQGCYVDADGKGHDAYDFDGDPEHGPRIGLWVPTLEGLMLGIEGDWIVRGTEGELYPVKPPAFAATFEPV